MSGPSFRSALSRTTLSVVAAAVFLAAFPAPASAASRSDSNSRKKQVEQSLLPPVIVEGERAFTIDERMRLYGVPGVAVAVWDKGRVEWVQGYGVADPIRGSKVTEKTLFQAGPISKAMTAVAVLKSLHQRKLPLDTPVNQLLSSWKLGATPLSDRSPVTVQRLLSHTGGIGVSAFPGFELDDRRPSVIEELNGTGAANTERVRVETEPGAAPRYSGGGYLILQQMLEDLERKPFDQIMNEAVLGPLKLRSATFEQPPGPGKGRELAAGVDLAGEAIPGGAHIYPEKAAGGLWISAGDLAKFVLAIQQSYLGKGSLLSAPLAREMAGGAPNTGGRVGLGLFLVQRKDTVYIAHPGGSFGFYGVFYGRRDEPSGVAVLTNAERGEDLSIEIVRAVAKVYGWKDFLPEPRPAVRLKPEELTVLAGRYRIDGDDVLTISVLGRQVIASRTLGDKYALIPISSTEFLRTDERERFRVAGADLVIETAEGQKRAVRDLKGVLTPSELLLAGEVDRGLAAYVNLAGNEISEPRLRERGLALLARKRGPAGLGLLGLNAKLHPESAAAWDALAGAQEANADFAGARASAEKVIRAMEDDHSSTASERYLYRKRALGRLRELH